MQEYQKPKTKQKKNKKQNRKAEMINKNTKSVKVMACQCLIVDKCVHRGEAYGKGWCQGTILFFERTGHRN